MTVDTRVTFEKPAADPAPPATRPAPRVPHWVRRGGFHIGVIALFSLPAVFLWWRAWADGAASTVRCQCVDPGQQVWFVAWPAYAIAHGLDPLFSNWLWPPHGVNLLDNASGPLIGIVLSPVTWLFGPFVATTLGATLAPGLSAWGCWIACRRFTTWPPASWVAGFLFGYSPVVVQNVGQGHLSVGLLVVPPLIVAVLHETLVRRERPPVWTGVTLGVLVVLQFFISAEVLTITAILALAGCLLAAALSPHEIRRALPYAARAFGVAALVAGVLLLAPVWELLRGPQHIRGSIWSGFQAFLTDRPYNLWNPANYHKLTWPDAPQGPQLEYLGIGFLVMAALSLAFAARRRSAWIMGAIAVLATVLSWGGVLWLSPQHAVTSTWLPWGHVLSWPVFQNLSPKTFAVLTDLAVALLVGIGLDAARWSSIGSRLGSSARAASGAVVVVVVALPLWLTYAAPFSVQRVVVPPWFATVGRQIPEGSVVATYPFPASVATESTPMVWQAAESMRFRLAGGYAKVPAAGGKEGVLQDTGPDSPLHALIQLTYVFGLPRPDDLVTARGLAGLRAELGNWGTSYIVVTDDRLGTEVAALFTAATGRMPVVSHRAWVWDLRQNPLPHSSSWDPTRARQVFLTCTLSAQGIWLQAVGPTRRLPQAYNRCIVAGLGTIA